MPPLAYVLGVTLVPALLLLLLQIVFAGSLTFLRANLFLLPAITLFSLIQALLVGVRDPGAVVAHQEPALRLDHVRRRHLLHGGDVSGAARHHHQPHVGGDFAAERCSTSSPMRSSAAGASRPVPVYVAVIVVLVIVGVAMLILERRIRGVEVVA